MDQNEKNGQDYGRTRVLMIDGCSRLIVGHILIPIKNPIIIYEYVFYPAVFGTSSYGSWARIRISHMIQQMLSCYCLERRKQPFKQTHSTEKNFAERMLPKVIQRTNYPVKRTMNEITETDNIGIFDIENHTFKFCVFWMMLHLTKNAMDHFENS